MRSVVIAAVLTATVAIATGTINLASDNQRNALTAIDQVPTKSQLDQAFPSGALQKLSDIATDPDTSPDAIGIRLRAIHALAKYCAATPCTSADLAHQSVVSVISATRSAQSGAQVLLLRAAIETLGAMRVSTDVSILAGTSSLLDHPSRDIRAATARALRDLCNPQAIAPLRMRYSAPLETDQVKLAISEALRILDQCASNP
jgi:hypothetical protein